MYAFDWNVVWWWSCRDGGAGTAAPVMVLALQIEFSAPSLPVPCFRILQKKKKKMHGLFSEVVGQYGIDVDSYCVYAIIFKTSDCS